MNRHVGLFQIPPLQLHALLIEEISLPQHAICFDLTWVCIIIFLLKRMCAKFYSQIRCVVGIQLSWQSIRVASCWCRFDSLVRQGNFLPESTFSADSLTVSVKTLCAIACIYICAHIKDPVVHIRVQWTMETLNHEACTIG